MTIAGNYELEISSSGQQISGSPFSVDIEAGPLFPTNTRVDGDFSSILSPNVPYNYTITVRVCSLPLP